MAASKFASCRTCYFENREPVICAECVRESEYQPKNMNDDEALEDLQEIKFYPMGDFE